MRIFIRDRRGRYDDVIKPAGEYKRSPARGKGAGDKNTDVTKQVARWAQDCRYIPLLRYRDLTNDDPARGLVKTLTIEYTLNGKPGKVTCPDNSLVILPKS